MMSFLKSSKIACALVLCAHSAGAMDLSHYYEAYFRPAYKEDSTWYVGLFAEKAVSDGKGYNRHGESVNALQIYNKDQNGLLMLQGFSLDSKPGQLREQLCGADDDGVRGHLCITGDIEHRFSVGFVTRAALPYNFFIGAYLPVYGFELCNVRVKDLTQDITEDDALVKENLTDDFCSVVPALGGPCLRGWQRTGIGDLTLLAEWIRNFEQHKPMLKNVELSARLGISFPTGKEEDIDLLMALPFGNDGALGVLFGGALDVQLGSYFHWGVDVLLTYLVNNARERRIRTQVCQTELILLGKSCVHRDWGITQRFNLFCRFDSFWQGFSAAAYYEFLKKGSTDVVLSSREFSTNIADKAQRMREKIAHTAVVKAQYDFGVHMNDDARIVPFVGIFAKIPFKGSRVLQFTTVGATLSVNFY